MCGRKTMPAVTIATSQQIHNVLDRYVASLGDVPDRFKETADAEKPDIAIGCVDPEILKRRGVYLGAPVPQIDLALTRPPAECFTFRVAYQGLHLAANVLHRSAFPALIERQQYVGAHLQFLLFQTFQ